MSKIICDICGTRYPDSAEQCPICGCVHNPGAEQDLEVETVMEEEFVASAAKAERGGHFSKSNVRKRNRNLPIYEEAEEEPAGEPEREDEDEDPFEELEESKGKGGVILNVLLVIVILALLAVSSYIFLKFFMPNFTDKQEPTAPSVVETLAPTEEATEEATEAAEEVTEAPTEDPNMACEQLTIEVTDITLEEPGAMFLLNVQVLPENTTDPIMYISSNENVATVNEEGCVTAVGEGTVVISIFCGEQQTECNVICSFAAAETEAPTEEATEAPTEGQKLKDVTLGVKSSDLTFRSGGQQATIKLTCKLDNDEVTWTSADESIATVDKNGIITRVGAGTTTITGTYGEQTVEIIVRCPKK